MIQKCILFTYKQYYHSEGNGRTHAKKDGAFAWSAVRNGVEPRVDSSALYCGPLTLRQRVATVVT